MAGVVEHSKWEVVVELVQLSSTLHTILELVQPLSMWEQGGQQDNLVLVALLVAWCHQHQPRYSKQLVEGLEVKLQVEGIVLQELPAAVVVGLELSVAQLFQLRLHLVLMYWLLQDPSVQTNKQYLGILVVSTLSLPVLMLFLSLEEVVGQAQQVHLNLLLVLQEL